jgi:plastocyanin
LSRLARKTVVTIIGLLMIVWITVVLWLSMNPQVAQNSQQTAQATGMGSSIVVQMNDQLRFTPTEITIKAGDTVEWRNIGLIPHTVTADPKRAPSSRNIELPDGAEAFDSGWVTSGQSFRYTFSEPGVYRYVCLPHEQARMAGIVIVG